MIYQLRVDTFSCAHFMSLKSLWAGVGNRIVTPPREQHHFRVNWRRMNGSIQEQSGICPRSWVLTSEQQLPCTTPISHSSRVEQWLKKRGWNSSCLSDFLRIFSHVGQSICHGDVSDVTLPATPDKSMSRTLWFWHDRVVLEFASLIASQYRRYAARKADRPIFLVLCHLCSTMHVRIVKPNWNPHSDSESSEYRSSLLHLYKQTLSIILTYISITNLDSCLPYS